MALRRISRNLALDSTGIVEVLQSSEVAGEVLRLAEAVAGEVRSDESVTRNGVETIVDAYTSGQDQRAAASVTMVHPAGKRIEAKYGPLTRGAAAQGGEVSQ